MMVFRSEAVSVLESLPGYLYNSSGSGVAVLPEFLEEDFRSALEQELQEAPYLFQDRKGERVDERFNYMKFEEHGRTFPENVALEDFPQLQGLVKEYAHLASGLEEFGLVDPHRVNSVLVLKYPVGPYGITAHKDDVRDRNFISVFTISGQGDFLVGKGRKDKKLVSPRRYGTSPGSLSFLRAPRDDSVQERKLRPWHSMENISEERIAVVLRHILEGTNSDSYFDPKGGYT